MRYLIILLAAFSLTACKDLEITQYEYHESTMMGRTITTITQDSVIVTFNGRGEPTYFARETKQAEWDALNAAMSDVDMEKVPSLDAPSDKRHSDAAPFAKFKFIGKAGEVMSAEFDGKKPNEMLMPLMEEIIKIQEENKK